MKLHKRDNILKLQKKKNTAELKRAREFTVEASLVVDKLQPQSQLEIGLQGHLKDTIGSSKHLLELLHHPSRLIA